MEKHCFFEGEDDVEECLLENDDRGSCLAYDEPDPKGCKYWHHCNMAGYKERIWNVARIIGEQADETDRNVDGWGEIALMRIFGALGL